MKNKRRSGRKTVYYRHSLERRQVTMISLGGVIGGSFFVGSGDLLQIAGPSLLLTFLLVTFVSIMVTFSIVDMSSRGTLHASLQTYVGQVYGRIPAALTGWSFLLAMVVGPMAEITAASFVLHSFFPHIAVPWFCLGLGLLVGLSGLLVLGRRLGEWESMIGFAKVVALLAFSLLGLGAVFGFVPSLAQPISLRAYVSRDFFSGGFAGTMACIAAVVMIFGGTEDVAPFAARSADPQRNLPTSAMSVVFRAAVVYVLSIFVLSVIVPASLAKADVTPFATAIRLLGGVDMLVVLFKVLVLTSVVTTATTGVFLASHMYSSLVSDGYLPRRGQAGRGGFINIETLACFMPLLSVPLTAILGQRVYLSLIFLSGFGFLCTWMAILLTRYPYLRKTAGLPGAPSWLRRLLQYAAILILLLGFVFMAVLPVGRPALLLGLCWLLLCCLYYRYGRGRRLQD